MNMFSKRKPESEASVSIMMYSAKEVESIVMDAISDCTIEDAKSDGENAGKFGLITMIAGAKILSKVREKLEEKHNG